MPTQYLWMRSGSWQSGAALGFHLLGFRKSEVFLPKHRQDRHGKWKRGPLAYLSRGQEHGTVRDQLTKKTPKGDTKLHCKRRGVAAGDYQGEGQSETARTVCKREKFRAQKKVEANKNKTLSHRGLSPC